MKRNGADLTMRTVEKFLTWGAAAAILRGPPQKIAGSKLVGAGSITTGPPDCIS